MRSSNRNFINKAFKKSEKRSIESRDAVLWEIDGGGQCRIKIQGSDRLITAHFPRNQRYNPDWVQKGNAVRVIHKGGIRGFIEVVGPGRAIPLPVGGAASLPDTMGTGDGRLTGMIVTQTYPLSLSVNISNGTFNINNVTYFYYGVSDAVDSIIMDDPAPMTMGTYPVIGMGASSFDLDPAPQDVGYFRYDILVIGTDRIIDYIKGEEVTSSPVVPEVPENHILVQKILRVYGDAVIEDERIGISWTPPKITSLYFEPDLEFPWSLGSDYPQEMYDMTFLDQYGSIAPTETTKLDLQLLGTGRIWTVDSGWVDEFADSISTTNIHTIGYERDQTASPEINPMIITRTVNMRPKLAANLTITLLSA